MRFPAVLVLLLTLVVLMVSTPLLAQNHPVAPPPKPADAAPTSTGPSLEVTLQFIADKINESGTMNYVAFFQDTTDGSTWSHKFSATFSQARPDAAQCRISYHVNNSLDGQMNRDTDLEVPLREVQDVVVMPIEQDITQYFAASGNPEYVTTSVSPPLTVVRVRRLHGGGSEDLDFTDASVADRVAKAITHAVDLCGGGAKPEPF